MQQGLENLNGFLNFVDAATIATGVGSVVGKGLRWGGKKVAKWLSKYATIAGVPITINNKTK